MSGKSAREAVVSNTNIQYIFQKLDTEGSGYVSKEKLLSILQQSGYSESSEILTKMRACFSQHPELDRMDFYQLQEVLSFASSVQIKKALAGQLRIQGFPEFCSQLQEIFQAVGTLTGGTVEEKIPQLASANPSDFSVAVCTVDAQQASFGDSGKLICALSLMHVATYLTCVDDCGEASVHKCVGKEPAGKGWENMSSLGSDGRPYNPLLPAGGLVTCAMLRPESSYANRYKFIVDKWCAACGIEFTAFNNCLFLSRRERAFYVRALAHMMKEAEVFPSSYVVDEEVEFFLQVGCLESSLNELSVFAATIANGGICPLSGKRVFSTAAVRSVLSLLVSCGMYDYSGEWAYRIGIPGKANSAGVILMVVPGICGLAVYSPCLDEESGISYRGKLFAERFVDRFPFHPFDCIVEGESCFADLGANGTLKKDPTNHKLVSNLSQQVNIFYAAAEGDTYHVQHILAMGQADVNAVDRFGRTALHLAAAEGHADVISILLAHGATEVMDVFGHTPTDDAEKAGHALAAEILASKGKIWESHLHL
jgi:glutaminase